MLEKKQTRIHFTLYIKKTRMLKKIKLIFKFNTIGLINASIYNIEINLTYRSQVIIIYDLIIHNLQVYERISRVTCCSLAYKYFNKITSTLLLIYNVTKYK